jgi:hypothetical protein
MHRETNTARIFFISFNVWFERDKNNGYGPITSKYLSPENPADIINFFQVLPLLPA